MPFLGDLQVDALREQVRLAQMRSEVQEQHMAKMKQRMQEQAARIR